MKLPPAALTAPSLCPRCDSPAMYVDRCLQCGLQLRECGSCHGVVGPFDRYCGFCGHFLAEGEARSPAWRLWLLVAMIPIVAGLAFGLSPLSSPVTAGVVHAILHTAPSPSVAPTPAGQLFRSPSLHLEYRVPDGWAPPADFNVDSVTPLPDVVVAKAAADTTLIRSTKGDLLATAPSSALVMLGTPDNIPAGADASDPSSVLAARIQELSLKPPAGYKISVYRPASSVLVDGRTGKEAVLQVTRPDGSMYDFEEVYLKGPNGLFRVDALVPAAGWNAGDGDKVEAIVQSVRLTG